MGSREKLPQTQVFPPQTWEFLPLKNHEFHEFLDVTDVNWLFMDFMNNTKNINIIYFMNCVM